MNSRTIPKKNVSKRFEWEPIFSPIVLPIHSDHSTFMKIFFFGLIIIFLFLFSRVKISIKKMND